MQRGRRYSVNVPLDNGIDDAAYAYVFNPIVSKCFEVFRPGAVVLQCGADSLGCDRLGTFNLSIRGHSECVRFVRSFGVPLLILGGGGYTIRNVSRCWAYETSVILDQPVSNELPRNTPYYEFYAPDYQLHPALYNMKQTRLENLNTRESLDRIKQRVIDQLHELRGAPSVQMHTIPILGDYESDASISFDHLLVKDSITPLATRPSLMKDLSG